MDGAPRRRECSWENSSSSSMDSSGSENETNSHGVHQPQPQAIHEMRVLRIPFQPEELEPHRGYWRRSLLGFLQDVRRFSTDYLQNCINREWGTSNSAIVVGRADNHYVISFDSDYDMDWVSQEGPWSFNGAFFFTELWRPNQPVSERSMQKIEIWVELWGLPLEYQQPDATKKIAQAAGKVIRVDWENTRARNIRFSRVRIAINPWKPLMPGCMITRDDGVDMWIPFKYQRVFKLCTNCGIIGHKRSYCPHQYEEVENMINQQIREASERVDAPSVTIPTLNQFMSEMKAYNKRRSRRTTTFYYLGGGDDTAGPSHQGGAQQENKRAQMELIPETSNQHTTGEPTQTSPQPPNQNTQPCTRPQTLLLTCLTPEPTLFIPENSIPNSPLDIELEPIVNLDTIVPNPQNIAPVVNIESRDFQQDIEEIMTTVLADRYDYETLYAQVLTEGEQALNDLRRRAENNPHIQPRDNTPRWVGFQNGVFTLTNGRVAEERHEQPESSNRGNLSEKGDHSTPVEASLNTREENMPPIICQTNEEDYSALFLNEEPVESPAHGIREENVSKKESPKRKRDDSDEESQESDSGRQIRRRLQLLDINDKVEEETERVWLAAQNQPPQGP
ncbi:hypothetical protein COLO4_22304 [Corchorus olitorius]|uniref:CCHC-type domain-containing protein n=1 Tax=Corchorus olitorius TaxID=93759 RepID=A0A1R3IMZ4_9ROSI|nr:hypothetical protein COLO4_22304 [Corchorus olitorius]